METLGHFIHVAIFLAMIAVTWIGPRSLGLPGLVAAHLLCVVGWFAMTAVSIYTGIWSEYEGGIVIFGLLPQAFVFNCLMLPVGIWAMFRWSRLSPLSPKYVAPDEAPKQHDAL